MRLAWASRKVLSHIPGSFVVQCDAVIFMIDQLDFDESIVELLEPNLQFYRFDHSDSNRYFVGPEVLHGIAWVATTIALPILLSATNELVKEKLKKWLERGQDSQRQLPSTAKSAREDLVRAMTDSPRLSISETQVDEASDAIATYLDAHGWPRSLAEADAREIATLIRGVIENRK